MPLPHFNKGNFAGLTYAHINALSDAIEDLQSKINDGRGKHVKHTDYFPAFIDGVGTAPGGNTVYSWWSAEWNPVSLQWQRVPVSATTPPSVPRWSYNQGGSNGLTHPAILAVGLDDGVDTGALVLMMASRDNRGTEQHFIVSVLARPSYAFIESHTPEQIGPWQWLYDAHLVKYSGGTFGTFVDITPVVEIKVRNLIEVNNLQNFVYPGYILSDLPDPIRPKFLSGGTICKVHKNGPVWFTYVANAWTNGCAEISPATAAFVASLQGEEKS